MRLANLFDRATLWRMLPIRSGALQTFYGWFCELVRGFLF